jgi:outer membrane lipoprotein-sorting protein
MAGTNDFTNYLKYPDKQRTEYGTSSKNKPAEIYNGDSGWNVNNGKLEELSAAEVKDFHAGLHTGFQYVARFILSKPGLTMQYTGEQLIDYKPNDTLEFRDSGNFFRLYVDQQTHLPTKMEVRRSGEAFIREEQYANWHEFQSIKAPLYIIRLQDGERKNEIRYSNVAYNTGLADSLFNPPSSR